jgi:hypothetical protein
MLRSSHPGQPAQRAQSRWHPPETSRVGPRTPEHTADNVGPGPCAAAAALVQVEQLSRFITIAAKIYGSAST